MMIIIWALGRSNAPVLTYYTYRLRLHSRLGLRLRLRPRLSLRPRLRLRLRLLRPRLSLTLSRVQSSPV